MWGIRNQEYLYFLRCRIKSNKSNFVEILINFYPCYVVLINMTNLKCWAEYWEPYLLWKVIWLGELQLILEDSAEVLQALESFP